MDPNGFDYKALRNAAPMPSNPPFSMLQKPSNPRKPFASIHTQSRNQTENRLAPPSHIAHGPGSRHALDTHNFKQEPHDAIMFSANRQAIPQPQGKTQTSKVRAFTMGNAVPEDQHFTPRYSSPNPASRHVSELAHLQPHNPQKLPPSRSPSFALEQELNTEDDDVSQLLARLRDSKQIKAKLTEQLRINTELESRLSSQLAASEASEHTLKRRINELEDREATRRAQAEEELRMAKAQSNDLERRFQELSIQTNQLRTAAKSGVESLTNNYNELQTYVKELKTQYDASQASLQNLSLELNTIRNNVAENLRGIEAADDISRSTETRALIDELQQDLISSQQVNDMLRDKLHLLSAQFVEAKERILDLEQKREGKIERVEARLEELTSATTKQTEEGARWFEEKLTLESRLKDSNEKLLETMNNRKTREIELDNLNDKVALLNERKLELEYQLQEERSRNATLEEAVSDTNRLQAEKASLERLVQEQTEIISTLRAVEVEAGTLKEGYVLKLLLLCCLVPFFCRNDVLQGKVKEHLSHITLLEQELSLVKDELVSFKSQLTDSCSKLVSTEDLHRQTTAKLELAADRARQLELQHVQQAAQATQLKRELDQANEQVQCIRGELHDSKAGTQSAVEMVAAANLRESLLQEKVSQLTERVNTLSADTLVKEEDLRKAHMNVAILQERFEAQSITLKLSKEQSGDLQERLLVAEKSHAAELESTIGKCNTEIAVLREQKAGLQASFNQVTEDAAIQRAGFVAATVDYEAKIAEQKDMHAKLVEAQEHKTQLAEKETAEAKVVAAQLEQQVETARKEAQEMKQRLRDAASASPNGEAIVLQARMEELEMENSKLQSRGRTLQKRYEVGDLSDSEKTFVNSLMQLSNSAHEQEMVTKENELRRRENMINSQQTQIDELRSTLARLLKERGKESDGAPKGKSMIDLNVWVSSSSPLTQAEDGKEAPPKKDVKPPPLQSISAINAQNSDDDISEDSEDDKKPPVTLGKRTRTPNADANSSRPARRQRATTGTSRKADGEARKVDGEKKAVGTETTKNKQRKRR
ncbi:hypothetical protein MIND_00098300 [Mycena indigotica]|uniref:Uncharacterized protein n=1 Tax=Mycena indigotica TaxID=2126181 RepID=A0A8H6TFM4_9AGAR|nr:uncharacterized protein MIND_00098300 [Mycena indigotica]KAF7315822.1 hypothetical protein MIND_00098300 [Mycena indigotica]